LLGFGCLEFGFGEKIWDFLSIENLDFLNVFEILKIDQLKDKIWPFWNVKCRLIKGENKALLKVSRTVKYNST
jgi:hypothetical protein